MTTSTCRHLPPPLRARRAYAFQHESGLDADQGAEEIARRLGGLPKLEHDELFVAVLRAGGEVHADVVGRAGWIKQLAAWRSMPADPRRLALRAALKGADVSRMTAALAAVDACACCAEAALDIADRGEAVAVVVVQDDTDAVVRFARVPQGVPPAAIRIRFD